MVSIESSTIELSTAQEKILAELINIYGDRSGTPVKGKEIAAALGRNPGTIRTQMQSLKSLQLVTGIPGPKGGYEPTANAYEVIDLERSSEFAPVPVRRDGDPLEAVTVTEFDLINLHHPDRREAEIYVQGSMRELSEGDNVRIGPTPGSGLVVEGVVEGFDTAESICVITVEEMHFESSSD
ncbi:MAG: TrmB family transcriptional regulator [Haloquadratum sp.]